MPTLERIRRALAAAEPRILPVEGRSQAGVAMVLCGEEDAPEVLFIERARHPHDPWSGHMAFPGGRVDPGDAHARAAAERETREEVGISLEGAVLLGRLDDREGYHDGRSVGMVISAYVYQLPRRAALTPNYEVEEALWFPLRALRDPSRHVDFVYRLAGDRGFPGIVVGDPERQVVWGLTYRFLESFFERLELPLVDTGSGDRHPHGAPAG